MPASSDRRRRGDQALRLLLATMFAVAGGMKLAATESEVSTFGRFGHAPWFMSVAGIARLLGAVSLRVRGFVAYGALFLRVPMVGCVVSHRGRGEGDREGGDRAGAEAPRRRYAAGPKARQVSLLRRFVPAGAFDKALRKAMRLPPMA